MWGGSLRLCSPEHTQEQARLRCRQLGSWIKARGLPSSGSEAGSRSERPGGFVPPGPPDKDVGGSPVPHPHSAPASPEATSRRVGSRGSTVTPGTGNPQERAGDSTPTVSETWWLSEAKPGQSQSRAGVRVSLEEEGGHGELASYCSTHRSRARGSAPRVRRKRAPQHPGGGDGPGQPPLLTPLLPPPAGATRRATASAKLLGACGRLEASG